MFPESSPFFLFLLFSFLTVFNTQCCFLAVRFLSHKPVLRWTRVVRRPRVVDSFCFFWILFACLFLRGRVVGHLSSLPCIVLRREQRSRSCGGVSNTNVSRWAIVHHTCGKPLLVERKSVSAALKFHINPWQGGPVVQKLHCQSGGVRGAVWKFKLSPQRPGTWRQTRMMR